MNVRLNTATIAIYFLFTLFVFTLYTNASQEENENITEPDLQQYHFPLTTCKDNICLIVTKFLTIKDIFILQKTCKTFQNLLQPNPANLVSFCNYANSKKIEDATIIWDDLKFFLEESYSVFNEMEMFNIKENQYVVLTRAPENKIIIWNNNHTPYPQILLDQATKNTQLANQQNSYISNNLEPFKIFNKWGSAWAIITKEGNVITGGNKQEGGNSSFEKKQLKNVKMIVSTAGAFAALLDNGRVVTWGFGIECIQPHHNGQLQNVKRIFSTNSAFAALLDDGGVVAWGESHFGGEIPDDIQNKLRNVKMIISTDNAFTALLCEGRVFAWGNDCSAAKIPDELQPDLQHVKMIFSDGDAFAFLLHNSSEVFFWGKEEEDGQMFMKSKSLDDVKMIFPTKSAFVVVFTDDCVDTLTSIPNHDQLARENGETFYDQETKQFLKISFVDSPKHQTSICQIV